MAGRYFGIPFATTGDRITVPDATQPDGSVSFTQGFGFDYERPNTDPAYKPVPRDGTNGLFHDITEALGIAQRQGVSDWTVDAQPYAINALVRHTDKVWRSLVANNNVTPVEGASWTEVGALASETVAGLVEKATAAEAQAFTADKFLDAAGLANAFLGSNVTKASTGKLRLPGGLMLQWISDSLLTIGSSTVNVTVNWNTPFSGAPYVAFSQAVTNSPNNFLVSNGTPTTTGVTVFSYATSSTTLPFFVFAIGPWA